MARCSLSEIIETLRRCSKAKNLDMGKSIHESVKDQGLESNALVGNALMDMYRHCRRMDLASETFCRMVHKDVISWNCLILGYAENGQSSVALERFSAMDCKPDHVTYLGALKACAGLASRREFEKQRALTRGVSVHKQLKADGFDCNIFVASTLVDMYCKCGSTELARDVFERMNSRNIVAWNCLVLGYVENGEGWRALELLTRLDCEPNHITYVGALKACASIAGKKESDKLLALEKGRVFHKQLQEQGFESNIFVASTLVDMYSKCGDMCRAKKVFDSISSKNVVSWTCLILGYAENGECRRALELFTAMDCEPTPVTCLAVLKACSVLASGSESVHQEVVIIHEKVKALFFGSNLAVMNSLVDLYCKCGDMHSARGTFDEMKSRDVVTWTCLILGYIDNDESSVALDVFNSMDCEPNRVTYIAVLKACGSLAALAFGRMIHGTVCKLGLEDDATVATTLVDFYARCGCMDTAVEIFKTMHSPGIVSWTALVAGYSSLGDSDRVFCLVSKLEEAGVQPNAVTFINILTACSHAGMVGEGERYFESMHKHGVRPTRQHYTCMVDMLGRANKLEKAVEILHRMPFEADEVTWMTLLDACRKWNNVEVARVVFDELKDHPAAYVLMRDIYRRDEQESQHLQIMKPSRLEPQGSCPSWCNFL